MIIFYSKETGVIKGILHGRLHSKSQQNMYIGTPEENNKLVIEWKKVSDLEWEPEHPQKDIVAKIDSGEVSHHQYKIVLNDKGEATFEKLDS